MRQNSAQAQQPVVPNYPPPGYPPAPYHYPSSHYYPPPGYPYYYPPPPVNQNTSSENNGLGIMINNDGSVALGGAGVSQAAAPAAAGATPAPQTQQQPQNSQQQPQQQSTTKKSKKKNKKKKKSQNQQAKSFSKNKLAEMLAQMQKDLASEKAKSALLEGRLKDADMDTDVGSNILSSSPPGTVIHNIASIPSNGQEQNANSSSSDSSSSNAPNSSLTVTQNASQNVDRTTTNTASNLFVAPKPAIVITPAVPSTPGRSSAETPARKLASEIIDKCNLVTPISKPKSTICSSSDSLNEDGGDGGSNNPKEKQVTVLSSISPIKEILAHQDDPAFVAHLHKRSGMFRDVNATYCSL